MRPAGALVAIILVGACRASPSLPPPTSDQVPPPTTTSTTSTTSTSLPPPTTSTTLPEPLFSVRDQEGLFDEEDSYRTKARIVISTQPEGEGDVLQSTAINAEFQREPRGVSATIRVDPDVEVQLIGLDERFWVGEEGVWVEEPTAEDLLALAGAELVSPQDLSSVSGLFAFTGVGSVNGRAVRFYRGGHEMLRALLALSEDPDLRLLDDLDVASADLWLDEQGFLLRAHFSFGGPTVGGPIYYLLEFEVYDFGAEVFIEPPSP